MLDDAGVLAGSTTRLSTRQQGQIGSRRGGIIVITATIDEAGNGSEHGNH